MANATTTPTRKTTKTGTVKRRNRGIILPSTDLNVRAHELHNEDHEFSVYNEDPTGGNPSRY